MAKRAVITCEVACSNCGDIILFDYKNSKTISRLKREAKDWIYCEEEGNICPDCYEEWKKRKKIGGSDV